MIMHDHPIVTRAQWTTARQALLTREKELTQLHDRLAEARRALPWVRIEKDYVFDSPDGTRRLADLFEGRSQLLVQHFMFAPGWDQGCKSCSFMADHIEGARPHLAQRDVTLAVVSRAPLAQIERFRQRMGWRFSWVSSCGTDFNPDFGVGFSAADLARGRVHYNYREQAFPQEEAPGISAFFKDATGTVFHTYSTYGRGVELMMGAYSLMDIAPRGRDEDGLGHPMEWIRHHDRYEPKPTATGASCCASRA
jgi:predicted dithiol-disulfide oxidoreductase (DUF899 family)